jgi:hydroxyacylglutathione hydrolase
MQDLLRVRLVVARTQYLPTSRPMTVKDFVVSPFTENCYVCHDAGEAVLIDPGTTTTAERQAVEDYISRNDLRVRHLLLTHAHLDHILGCAYFAKAFGMKWKLHPDDLPLLEAGELQAQMFGVPLERPPAPDASLAEGQTIQFGNARWKVLHTPGHSPGSVSFYDEANGFVIGGDVLFEGSIGRTDLWGGSLPVLLSSIREKLFPLPDDTKVYSGHGGGTTIGRERRSNPFLIGELA